MENSTGSVVMRTGNAQWQFLRKLSIKALSMFAASRNSRLEAIVDEAVEEFHAEITVQHRIIFCQLMPTQAESSNYAIYMTVNC